MCQRSTLMLYNILILCVSGLIYYSDFIRIKFFFKKKNTFEFYGETIFVKYLNR